MVIRYDSYLLFDLRALFSVNVYLLVGVVVILDAEMILFVRQTRFIQNTWHPANPLVPVFIFWLTTVPWTTSVPVQVGPVANVLPDLFLKVIIVSTQMNVRVCTTEKCTNPGRPYHVIAILVFVLGVIGNAPSQVSSDGRTYIVVLVSGALKKPDKV